MNCEICGSGISEAGDKYIYIASMPICESCSEQELDEIIGLVIKQRDKLIMAADELDSVNKWMPDYVDYNSASLKDAILCVSEMIDDLLELKDRV